MIATEAFTELGDGFSPPPLWEWMVLFLIVMVMILDGCMRRGVPL